MPSLRLSAKANIVGDGSDWAVEAMLRFSLIRLRGWAHPWNGALPAGRRFPRSISRLLDRLRTFPAEAGDEAHAPNARIAHLVATLGEGRALHDRGECDFDFALPGGAAALLADLTRTQFKVDEEIATRLPKRQGPWPSWTPVRRPARAWLGLALRLDILAEDDPQPDDPAIETMAAGARLLAIEAELRSHVLELWAVLDDADRERIRRAPGLGVNEPIDGTALLHRDQENGPEYAGPGMNLRFLFDALFEATVPEAAPRFQLIGRVTPLGWAVALTSLTTVALRKQPSAPLSAARAAVEAIAADLLVSTDPEGEAPWDDLGPLATKLLRRRDEPCVRCGKAD